MSDPRPRGSRRCSVQQIKASGRKIEVKEGKYVIASEMKKFSPWFFFAGAVAVIMTERTEFEKSFSHENENNS